MKELQLSFLSECFLSSVTFVVRAHVGKRLNFQSDAKILQQ